MKNKILLIITILLFPAIICFAQKREQELLHVSAECIKEGQKTYEGLEYMFSKLSEYVKNSSRISKTGMDSVRQAATVEYFKLHPEARDTVSEKSATDLPPEPQCQELLNEIMSSVQSFSQLQGTNSLSEKLGAINLKAAKSLSKKDAEIVHSVSCVTYYSTRYWQENTQQWLELGEKAKDKMKDKMKDK